MKTSLKPTFVLLGSVIIICLVILAFFVIEWDTKTTEEVQGTSTTVVPAVGAIRWDYWSDVHKNENPILSLNDSAWSYRLPFFAKPADRALLFDGVDDAVTMGDQASLEGLETMTVSTWVKVTGFSTQGYVPVGKEGVYRIVISPDGSGHFVVATANNGWYSPGTTASFPALIKANTWHHITGTYDGTTVRVYIDGVLQGSSAQSISGTLLSNTNAFTLGGKVASNIAFFKGALDDVRVYNRAVSGASIKQLHHGQAVEPSALLAQWGGTLTNTTVSAEPPTTIIGTASGGVTTTERSPVEIIGNSQEVVDKEIQYAAQHDLDYWAFVYYPLTPENNYGLNLYRSSAYKHLLNFALIWEGNAFWHFQRSQASAIEELATFMQEPTYQKTADGRPILYLFGVKSFPNFFGSVEKSRQKIAELRKGLMDKGLPNPFIVNMMSWEADATNEYGLDGASSYTVTGAGAQGGSYLELANANKTFWNVSKERGHALIPPVNVGWDPRPLYALPPSWGISTASGWYQNPTKTELKNHLAAALTSVGNLRGTLLDRSGSGNHGSARGGVLLPDGKVNGSYNFDGVDDYIHVGDPSSLEGMNALTISLWVKLRVAATQNYTPIGKNNAYRLVINPQGAGHFAIATTNNGWYSSGTTASFPALIKPNTWHHIVGTYDGSAVKVYVDGVLQGTTSGTVSGNIISNAGMFAMGQKTATNVDWFDGSLDEVRVYKRALSPEEVKALASQKVTTVLPLSTNDELVGYWQLDGAPESIMLYAWNEYAEGNQGLTPTLEGKKEYLEAVEEAKRQFIETYVPPTIPPPPVIPGSATTTTATSSPNTGTTTTPTTPTPTSPSTSASTPTTPTTPTTPIAPLNTTPVSETKTIPVRTRGGTQ